MIFRRFRARRRCPHLRQRCVHGDEINFVGGRRGQCLDCGRYLDPLPFICSATGVCHSTLYGEAPQELACRGFYDRHPTLPLRLAAALDRIRFVRPP